MKIHNTAALGAAYFIGWALVLSALILSSKDALGNAVYFSVDSHKMALVRSVIFAWICFTIPCALVARIVRRGGKP